MKTIVIPVKSGCKHNNIELKYAIRSLVKNLKDLGDIIIIGEKINSLKGLKYIHVKDDTQSKYKERNIYRKILAACSSNEVSEEFIFTNNDIYLTKEFDTIPFYHKATIEQTMERNKGDYRKSLNHTKKYLEQNRKVTLDFDTHFPIVYNKEKFIDTFVNSNLNWDQHFGYVIKSLYCNMSDIHGEYGGDCKIQVKMGYEEIKKKISGRSFFSTSDGCINEDMIRVLEELFPEKTIYEK